MMVSGHDATVTQVTPPYTTLAVSGAPAAAATATPENGHWHTTAPAQEQRVEMQEQTVWQEHLSEECAIYARITGQTGTGNRLILSRRASGLETACNIW